MPGNWTVAMNPPSKDEAQVIVEKGIEKTNRIVSKILNGNSFHHEFNFPTRISNYNFYKDYFLFKYLGVSNMWRNFRTDKNCNGCKTCKKSCPTNSISMKKKRPEWSKSCEQCMRCVNYCPQRAIYQKNYGSIKGRNIYYDKEFRHLVLKESKDDK